MSAATENVEHPQRTQRSGFRYLLTAKHHGGDKNAAMWLTSITREEEFSIFDLADTHEVVDERRWLFGVLLSDEGGLRQLGKNREQVAEFQPGNAADEPWHGYPKWPVDRNGPANRRKRCPNRIVFDRMIEVNLISKLQRKSLLAGRKA